MAQVKRSYTCPHCERPTRGEVVGETEAVEREADGTLVCPIEYALVKCDNCDHAVVQIREDHGGGFDLDEPGIVYPAPHRLSFDIPFALRKEWEEAQTCLQARAYRASVVMVRRTLEGAAVLNGVKERTLAKSLKSMSEAGLLDSTLSEWADELRALGNRGAHFSDETVSRQDAEDALAFSEALLDHIYVLRRRFDEFRARGRGEK